METFFKINEHMQNLYFKLAAILNRVCLDLIVIFYNRNGVEDLKYKWFAHKSKHNRW